MNLMLVYKKWTIMQQLNKNKFVKMDPKQGFNVSFKLTLLEIYNVGYKPILLASLMLVLERHQSLTDIKALQ